jgi:RNA polymerase sigma-70 factor, ECF subfamily
MSQQETHSEDFVRLITQFQGRLYAYLLSLLADADAANDVLQETNVVLWKDYRQYVPGSNFKAWAFRIAHFQCMAYRQKKLRDRVVFDDDVVAAIASESKAIDSDYEDRVATLERCLAKLHPRSREVLRLRYAEDIAVKEVARRTKKTPNAISQLLFRARSWLMECVKRQEIVEGSP